MASELCLQFRKRGYDVKIFGDDIICFAKESHVLDEFKTSFREIAKTISSRKRYRLKFSEKKAKYLREVTSKDDFIKLGLEYKAGRIFPLPGQSATYFPVLLKEIHKSLLNILNRHPGDLGAQNFKLRLEQLILPDPMPAKAGQNDSVPLKSAEAPNYNLVDAFALSRLKGDEDNLPANGDQRITEYSSTGTNRYPYGYLLVSLSLLARNAQHFEQVYEEIQNVGSPYDGLGLDRPKPTFLEPQLAYRYEVMCALNRDIEKLRQLTNILKTERKIKRARIKEDNTNDS